MFERKKSAKTSRPSTSLSTHRSLRSPAPAYSFLSDSDANLNEPVQGAASSVPLNDNGLPGPPPSQPASLFPPRYLSDGRNIAWHISTSTFMVGCSVALLVFAGVVAHLHDRPIEKEEHWDQIQTIYNRLATIYPILFAIVMGSTARHLGGYMLERGAPLRRIEMLVGSNTVGGTVSTAWQLRSFHWRRLPLDAVALGLLVLWSFSPLGSQSSLQMVRRHEAPQTSPLQVTYLDTTVSNDTAWATGAAGPGYVGGDTYLESILNSLYNTLLIGSSSQRNSSRDVWGNLRIPDLARSEVQFGRNESGWVVFQSTDGNSSKNSSNTINTIPIYSSLLGIPFLHNDSTTPVANSTFLMESSYLAIDCPTIHVSEDARQFPNCTNNFTSYENGTWASSWDIKQQYANNQSSVWSLCIDGLYETPTYGIVAMFGNETDPDRFAIPPARNLLFRSAPNVDSSFMYTSCPVKTAYIESEVLCSTGGSSISASSIYNTGSTLSSGSSSSSSSSSSNTNTNTNTNTDSENVHCRVVAMRESQMPHPHENLTDLSFQGAWSQFPKAMAASIGTKQHVGTTSMTEYFLINPNYVTMSGINVANWSRANAVDVSLHLQQVVNTYWYGTYGAQRYTHTLLGNDPGAEEALSAATASGVITAAVLRSAAGARTVGVLVYQVRWAWWSVFLVSTIVMLVSAIAHSLLVLGLNRGPSVLGYAASVVANSPYVPAGYGIASTMGGLERARLMGDVRVRLVDVDPAGESGFVAIAQEGSGYQSGSLRVGPAVPVM